MRRYALSVGLGFMFCLCTMIASAADEAVNARRQMEQASSYLLRTEKDLRAAFSYAGESAPGGIAVAIKQLTDKSEAWKDTLQGEVSAVDLQNAQGFMRQMQQANNILQNIQSTVRQMGGLAEQYPLCRGSEYFEACRSHLRVQVSSFSSALGRIAEGKMTDFQYPEADAVKAQLLQSVLQTVQMRQSLIATNYEDHSGYPRLPDGNPIVREFAGFCDDFLASKKADLAAVDAWREGKTQRPGSLNRTRRDESVHLWSNVIQKERDLVNQGEQFKGVTDTDAFKAYEGAVRKTQELMRRLIALSSQQVENRTGDRDMQALYREIQGQERIVQSAREGIEMVRQMMQERKALDELMERCPEMKETDYSGRFNSLADEIAAAASVAARANTEGRRVAVVEAQGVMALLGLRMQLLRQSAEEQSQILPALKVAETHAGNKQLAESIRQLKEAQAKLKAAWDKFEKASLTGQEVRNRINMLQLKQELSQRSSESLNQEYYTAREAARQAAQRINEQESRGGWDADIEGADSIPMEAPVDCVESESGDE